MEVAASVEVFNHFLLLSEHCGAECYDFQEMARHLPLRNGDG